MNDYIPKKDSKKLIWLKNFNSWVAANGATHGLSPAEIAEFDVKTDGLATAYTDNVTAQAAARGATAHKNEVFGDVVAFARTLAQRIQYAPNTTDQDRGNAGLTIPDDKPTPPSEDEILTITPPDIYLDFSIRLQVTIHWGPTPQDERHNGHPPGVTGCEIQYHKGGLPTHVDDWRQLDTNTDSPYIHTVRENEPTTYAYRVCYFGKKLKHGPYGAPSMCTVNI